MDREEPLARGAHEVTELLAAHAAGDEEALGELFRSVYAELLRLARSQRRRLGGGETLDTVGLVHECYLKLVAGAGIRRAIEGTSSPSRRAPCAIYWSTTRGRAAARNAGSSSPRSTRTRSE